MLPGRLLQGASVSSSKSRLAQHPSSLAPLGPAPVRVATPSSSSFSFSSLCAPSSTTLRTQVRARRGVPVARAWDLRSALAAALARLRGAGTAPEGSDERMMAASSNAGSHGSGAGQAGVAPQAAAEVQVLVAEAASATDHHSAPANGATASASAHQVPAAATVSNSGHEPRLAAAALTPLETASFDIELVVPPATLSHSSTAPALASAAGEAAAAAASAHAAEPVAPTGPADSAAPAASSPGPPTPSASSAAGATEGTAAAPSPGPEPFTLVRRTPLAGGHLDVVAWHGERMLRVWTPPGYTRADAAREPYPVIYLNDGQNLYGDKPTLSGQSWHAAEAAAGLIMAGELPPFVIVGIDHSGATRSYDYLPCPPGNAGGFRLDADNWPGGGVDAYLAALVSEVLPYAERSYGVSDEPHMRALGGSSFGGIAALCGALRQPGVWGGFLVESPSLWFGEERMLKEDVPGHSGPWPARLFLAMGSKEYSGLRKGEGAEFDEHLVDLTHQLAGMLEARGLARDSRMQVVIGKGATHTESAWAGRLPAALRFLCGPWWGPAMARRADRLFFTVPRKLRAGQPAVLFFNQARSTPLADKPPGGVRLAYGFNVDWSVGSGRVDMQPAAGLAALRAEAAAARRRQQQAGQQAQAQKPGQESEQKQKQKQEATEGRAVTETGAGAGAAAAVDVVVEVAAASAAGGGLPAVKYDIVGDPPGGWDEAACGESWLQAAITVPPEAYEMHLAFADSTGEVWDNNAGANFYLRVRQELTAAQRAASVEVAMAADGAAWGDVQEIAHRRGGSLYFTTPEVLVAGAPAVLYVNRRRAAAGLGDSPNLRALCGFNAWSEGSQELFLKPTSLWRGHDIDWWSATLTVPDNATDLSFVLSDGAGAWDNNRGANYMCPVKQPRGLAAAGGAAGGGGGRARGVASVESMPHAAGTLHIVTLSKREGTAARSSKWTEEKRLRVWTPPGWDPAKAPPGGYPVLYMQDGQNMFEDWLAHQGVSWRVGYTASDLITAGELPPFIVVAVDSAGAMRSLNYLPYPPGTGAGGFRGDAERWPGGGLEAYMTRLVEEVMPLVQDRFAAASEPAKVAFGGGSFAGVAALYAALHYPHVFGAVLAESPSLWIAEGRFLQDMRSHPRGMLPERLFLGCGTREYSATRDHDREDVDALLLSYCCEAAAALEVQGLRGPGRLRLLVEDGAGHHELAWQWRLTGAMRFLFAAWWDE